jgi:hypothetical protein
MYDTCYTDRHNNNYKVILFKLIKIIICLFQSKQNILGSYSFRSNRQLIELVVPFWTCTSQQGVSSFRNLLCIIGIKNFLMKELLYVFFVHDFNNVMIFRNEIRDYYYKKWNLRPSLVRSIGLMYVVRRPVR